MHVHIRGHSDWWLAPAQLRSFIFRREMSLVLDTVSFAERQFLATQPALADAPVLVHFHTGGRTDVESWGCLSCLRGVGVSVSEHQRRLAHACSPPVDTHALLLSRETAPAVTASRAAPTTGPSSVTPAPWQASKLAPSSSAATSSLRAVRPSLAPVAATAQHRHAHGDGDEVLIGSWSRHHPRSGGGVRTRTT